MKKRFFITSFKRSIKIVFLDLKENEEIIFCQIPRVILASISWIILLIWKFLAEISIWILVFNLKFIREEAHFLSLLASFRNNPRFLAFWSFLWSVWNFAGRNYLKVFEPVFWFQIQRTLWRWMKIFFRIFTLRLLFQCWVFRA